MTDVMMPYVPLLSIDSAFISLGGLLTSVAQNPEEFQIFSPPPTQTVRPAQFAKKTLFLRSIHTHCLGAYFHPLGHSPCNANCPRSVRVSIADLLRKSKDRRTRLAIHPPPASIAVNASPFPADTAPSLLKRCSMISWTPGTGLLGMVRPHPGAPVPVVLPA